MARPQHCLRLSQLWLRVQDLGFPICDQPSWVEEETPQMPEVREKGVVQGPLCWRSLRREVNCLPTVLSEPPAIEVLMEQKPRISRLCGQKVCSFFNDVFTERRGVYFRRALTCALFVFIN